MVKAVHTRRPHVYKKTINDASFETVVLKRRVTGKIGAAILLTTFLALTFTACHTGTVDSLAALVKTASPETSALAVYYFDGENTTLRYESDLARRKGILADLEKLKTVRASAEDLENWASPAYALSITDRDGWEIWISYSNGLWFLGRDGTVLRGEYDMKKVFDETPADQQTVLESGVWFPNAAVLGTYHREYYRKVLEQEEAPEGVSLKFLRMDGEYAVTGLQNSGISLFTYGEQFAVHRKLDGDWYELPVRMTNVSWNEPLYELQPGETREIRQWIKPWEALEPGEYRIALNGLYAEFEVQ